MPTLELRDETSGAVACIAPQRGFNCFRLGVPGPREMLEVLYHVPGFERGEGRPSGSGIPLLFPFPGRIRGDRFAWQGRAYPLELEPGRADALHGFVHVRPWRVTAQAHNSATGEFHAARDAPELLARWPADFRIVACYTLAGNSLAARYTLENRGPHELPLGFGTHAYFRVPLGGTQARRCVLRAPVDALWELDQMHATGRHFPHSLAAQLAAGMPLGETTLDNVFGLRPEDGMRTTRVLDPESGVAVVQEFDSFFPYCVAYTPPHRQAVCLEPYSCVPDAFRLASAGIAAGLRVLGPGEQVTAAITIRVEQVA